MPNPRFQVPNTRSRMASPENRAETNWRSRIAGHGKQVAKRRSMGWSVFSLRGPHGIADVVSDHNRQRPGDGSSPAGCGSTPAGRVSLGETVGQVVGVFRENRKLFAAQGVLAPSRWPARARGAASGDVFGPSRASSSPARRANRAIVLRIVLPGYHNSKPRNPLLFKRFHRPAWNCAIVRGQG